MKILVTGATGYVGGRLVPLLLENGQHVRTTVNGKRPPAWWSDRVETVPMDVLDPQQVQAACEGVDAVYYLIHGMGGDDFVETDRAAAKNMTAAIDANHVGRVVYLSGIVPPVGRDALSDHIRSRLEVEEILASSTATAISLRAAILLGSGSTSFEIVRQVSERLPVRTMPDWMDSQVQPIAIVDALQALLGALTVDTPSRTYDVGGPERMSYSRLLERYAAAAGLTRPQIDVPLVPTQVVGWLVGQLTDVPSATVASLVESLHHDMVCAEEDFRTDLLPAGYRLVGTDEAIRRALAGADQHTAPDQADPMGPLPQDPDWAGGGSSSSIPEKMARVVSGLIPGIKAGD